jgi:hypothetical protein
MRTAFKNSLGIFVALALVLAAAVAFVAFQQHVSSREVVFALSVLSVLGGVPVVTYAYPVIGTVAPTAAQAANATMLTATVFLDTSDTTTTVTHNWGISQANQNSLFPTIILTRSDATGTVSGLVTATIPASSTTPANSITINKVSTGAGTGGTHVVTLLRPHTLLGGV